MPLASQPDWLPFALWAIGAAVALFALFSLPRIGPLLRGLFSIALMALMIFVVLRQAPFEPSLARLTEALGLDNGQQVVGREVRIRMSPDGHFWAGVEINGHRRRMLIDSGATVTALSEETVQLAGVDADSDLVPMALRTANGVVPARTGTVERLTLGGIEARKLKVVTSPGLGSVNVLGMNFLSQLASWRVEGRTLILTPKGALQTESPAAS
jgi:aspartyl protease family protein